MHKASSAFVEPLQHNFKNLFEPDSETRGLLVDGHQSCLQYRKMCSRATFDRVSNISELIKGLGSAVMWL